MSLMTARYRFYREHKYLTFLLFELERLIAKTDFRVNQQITAVKTQLSAFAEMLEGHARHEENAIHSLLKKKGSPIFEQIEKDHHQQNKQLAILDDALNIILQENDDKKLSLGYEFYCDYRLLLIDNLQHFLEEETLIMGELHKLYSDEELKSVDRNTYQQMTPEEMIEMLQVLSPHIDPSDKEFFLNDIKEAQPEKFVVVSAAAN